LDHLAKSYYNSNGYLPADEFRIILRLGYAETMIQKGKHADAVAVMSKGIDEFGNSSLMPKLLAKIGITNYIKTKDKHTFMQLMKNIQINYPNSLEAKMYFWDE